MPKKSSQKKNAEKKKQKETLSKNYEKHENAILSAHKNENLTFQKMDKSEFESMEKIAVYRSGKNSAKTPSSYSLIMVDGKPAYARAADHWGEFSTTRYNSETMDYDLEPHNWKLTGAEKTEGTQVGYILLKDLPEEGRK